MANLAAAALAALITISLGWQSAVHAKPVSTRTVPASTPSYLPPVGTDAFEGLVINRGKPYFPPPPPATPAPAAPAPAPASGGYVYAVPVSHPAPPPITIGSTQQALINQDRASAGLGALNWSSCLAGIAYQNALRMANQGYISHAGGASADLGCGLGYQGGENVGYWSAGINDYQLNSMFMSSPDHRANIMGPYHYVGTAWVVARNGYAYIAVEFS